MFFSDALIIYKGSDEDKKERLFVLEIRCNFTLYVPSVIQIQLTGMKLRHTETEHNMITAT